MWQVCVLGVFDLGHFIWGALAAGAVLCRFKGSLWGFWPLLCCVWMFCSPFLFVPSAIHHRTTSPLDANIRRSWRHPTPAAHPECISLAFSKPDSRHLYLPVVLQMAQPHPTSMVKPYPPSTALYCNLLYLTSFLREALEAVQHIWWCWCACIILAMSASLKQNVN